MLLLFATKTEADPFIRALSLRLLGRSPFLLYGDERTRLIISGIGRIASASAASYALALAAEPIVNIGYAAWHKEGVYEVTKVIERCSDKVFHLPERTHLPKASCTTLDKPATSPLSTIADMEASAVVQVGRRFGVPVTIIKIISDPFAPEGCEHTSELMERYFEEILSQIGLQLPKNFKESE